MTDREMLVLAAKAAGVPIDPVFGPGEWHGPVRGNKLFSVWNPRDDDGESLRLAVALGLTIHCPHKSAKYSAVGTQPNQLLERARPDPYAATRRAIVRAAAEIGKAIP